MRPSKTFLLSPCLMLAACGMSMKMPSVSDLPGLKPYRINVQQGNALTQEMVAKLKLGMTRSQVRFVLGTPMVQDAFHSNRWDYVYLFTEGHKETRTRRLTVIFDGERLVRLEGDVVGRPGGSGETAPPAAPPAAALAPAAPMSAPAPAAAAPAEPPAGPQP
jgi:outer membrane protein assembly factor BamE